jgi:hypothetical protein
MVLAAVRALAPSTRVRGDGNARQPTAAEAAQFAVGLATFSGGVARFAAIGRPGAPLPPEATEDIGTKAGSVRRPFEEMPHPAGVGGGGGGAGGPKRSTSTDGVSADTTVVPSALVRSAGVSDVSVVTLAPAAVASTAKIVDLTVKAVCSFRRADAVTERMTWSLATPSNFARPAWYAEELKSDPTMVSKIMAVLYIAPGYAGDGGNGGEGVEGGDEGGRGGGDGAFMAYPTNCLPSGLSRAMRITGWHGSASSSLKPNT